MLFSSWLRYAKGSLERRATRSQNRRRRSPARRFAPRPFLETLEDRVVPASLDYSTLLNANVYATAVDSQGNMYVTGQAQAGFSATPGAFDTNGSAGAPFVAKLSPTGNVIYATYLGGSGSYDAGTGIAVDAAGDAYVIGDIGGVPTTANAISADTNGVNDFVAELNPTGSALLYGTYLPGTVNYPMDTEGCAGAIALDGSGNIYVAGCAVSGLPVTANAFQSTVTAGNPAAGPYYAFVMKIDPALSGTASLLYSSYLGGSSSGDQATGIAVDGAGNAYVEGDSGSGLPTTSGAFQTTVGSNKENAFVAKFDPSLSGSASLVYSTYLGGNGLDGDVLTQDGGVVLQTDGGIAVDSQGNAYVTSATTSSNFPTTPGAYQTNGNFGPRYNGLYGAPPNGIMVSDVFVTKLNATGSALIYSTYLGGGTVDGYGTSSGGASIALDANGDAYVTGWTNSTTFPTANPLQSTNNSGGFDSFVTELNPAGSALLFSTYLGGSSGAYGYGIAVDSAGNIYDAGATFAGYNNNPTSGFAAKINLAPSPSFAVSGFPSSTTAGVAQTVTVTALNANGTVNTGYTGTVQFTSSDPQAVLPANYTFTAANQGVQTFTVTLKTAGTQSITATDTATGSITGTESGIVVNPAAAASLSITGLPSSVKAGAATTFTVTAEDAYGNTATGYRGTVHFTSSDTKAKLPANYTFTASANGSHTFTNGVTFETTGTQTLTATDTATSTIKGTATVQVVNKSGPQVATATNPAPATASAGSSQSISTALLSPSSAGGSPPPATDADPSELSSVEAFLLQDDALALLRLDALMSWEAGAMGYRRTP